MACSAFVFVNDTHLKLTAETFNRVMYIQL